MSELALQRIREAKRTQATRLDLGDCGLTELPDELFELTWLEELMLCTEGRYFDFKSQKSIEFITENEGEANEIHSFCTKIYQLSKLKILLANGAIFFDEAMRWQVNDLNPLKDLVNLQILDVSSTMVHDLRYDCHFG